MCVSENQQDLRLATRPVIKNCSEYKYLELKISGDGTVVEAISERNTQRRKAISMLNSILQNKNITVESNKELYCKKL